MTRTLSIPTWITFITLSCFLISAGSSAAIDFPSKPDQKNFYVDEAWLISEGDGQTINQLAGALLTEEKVGLIVVTISAMSTYGAGDYTIEKYAYELFNHWGIGSKNRNYGMLLLVSKGDRRARIELGSAWGHSYNYQAEQVMNDLIIPLFKRGEFSLGIAEGVRGMDAMARGLELPKPKKPWWILPLYLGIFALIVGVIISLFKSGRSGWGWALIALLGVLLFFILRQAVRRGGSGGAFGGGFSGGGGASGSW
jgi:uncharacterized protein